MTRVADAMLCVHDVVLGKELTFLHPAPRALRLVQFTRETRSRKHHRTDSKQDRRERVAAKFLK
jgi:hypothetical protein